MRKIFSGPNSRYFWHLINKLKDKEVADALYSMGCRLQEFETKVDNLHNPSVEPDKAHAASHSTGCTWCGGKGILPCEVCGWEPPRT